MSGLNLRGRPRRGWIEEKAIGLRGMSVEQGRESASDRHEWRAVVCGYMVSWILGVVSINLDST